MIDNNLHSHMEGSAGFGPIALLTRTDSLHINLWSVLRLWRMEDSHTSPCFGICADEKEPDAPQVAIFYSINSTQRGLANIELGNLLIKQAARILVSQHPSITNLLTLSPLPAFRSWLITQLQRELPEVTCPKPHGA
jgi:hypothetical protein